MKKASTDFFVRKSPQKCKPHPQPSSRRVCCPPPQQAIAQPKSALQHTHDRRSFQFSAFSHRTTHRAMAFAQTAQAPCHVVGAKSLAARAGSFAGSTRVVAPTRATNSAHVNHEIVAEGERGRGRGGRGTFERVLNALVAWATSADAVRTWQTRCWFLATEVGLATRLRMWLERVFSRAARSLPKVSRPDPSPQSTPIIFLNHS